MRCVPQILCVLCVFFTIAHASYSSFPTTCQAAQVISSLTYSFIGFLQAGDSGPLTNQCSVLASAVTEAWLKYTPTIPEEISAKACSRVELDLLLSLETTGYADCTPRPTGICAVDFSEIPSATSCASEAMITNALLIPGLPYYFRMNSFPTRQAFDIRVEQVRARADLIPANDECANSINIVFPFTHTGSTMYSTPSTFSCRDDASLAIGDVFYSFTNSQMKDFVACASWGIQLSLIDASFSSVCSTQASALRGTVSCYAQATRGSDNCARISTNLAAGYVVISGDAPLSRGDYTFTATLAHAPVIICPPDLVRTSSVCSGPAYYGATGVPTLIGLTGNPLRYSKSPKAPYYVGRNVITFTVYDDLAGLSSSCVQTLTINPASNLVCQE